MVTPSVEVTSSVGERVVVKASLSAVVLATVVVVSVVMPVVGVACSVVLEMVVLEPLYKVQNE